MDDNGSAHSHSSLFGNLSTEEVASKIILTVIIVLFIAVLFVLILHLYAKLYWWRLDQLQQQQQQQEQEDQSSITPPLIITRRQRRRFILLPGPDVLSNTSGLTPFELSSLPVVFFRQDRCKEGLECAICLSELVKGDKARLLPKCSHSFHVECVDMWFQSHSTCPICRKAVFGLEHVSNNAADFGITNVHNDALSQTWSSVTNSSRDFPTNVLVWGREDQVSTRNTNVGSQEEGTLENQDAVVVDINDSTNRSHNVPSLSLVRFIVEEEEEPKSPMTTRLRSLRRFLSRDKRVSCSTSSSSNAASSSVDP